MRWYGLRAALLAVALCAVPLAVASIWLGLVGAAAVSALLVALGWISFFHSERTVLSAVGARLVSEVSGTGCSRYPSREPSCTGLAS